MKSFDLGTDNGKKFIELFEKDKENIKRVINQIQHLEARLEIHPRAKSVEESVKHSNVDKNQIIKTIIFDTEKGLIAVLCPGNKRIDEDKLAEVVGREVKIADPEKIANSTGYIVGGVSPFDLDIPIYASSEIPEGEVRPSAGSRVVGVKINKEKLIEVTGAEMADISE